MASWPKLVQSNSQWLRCLYCGWGKINILFYSILLLCVSSRFDSPPDLPPRRTVGWAGMKKIGEVLRIIAHAQLGFTRITVLYNIQNIKIIEKKIFLFLYSPASFFHDSVAMKASCFGNFATIRKSVLSSRKCTKVCLSTFCKNCGENGRCWLLPIITPTKIVFMYSRMFSWVSKLV